MTHFDAQGNAIMADVTEKKSTVRQAKAIGRITVNQECFCEILQGTVKKGDVLSVARIAGIMAVKQTPAIIPLCHPLLITGASIDFTLDDTNCQVTAECTVTTTGQTGVEMEALHGVSAALLTIYDMCKSIDRAMEISGIRLLEKSGGKGGTYRA